MGDSKRRMIEGWIDKAWNQLQTAKEHVKSPSQYSEAIQAAQECTELSVKSILTLFDIAFSPSHGWEQDKKQFAAIAEQIQKKQLVEKLAARYLNSIINLPRLLFLLNFWAQTNTTAKYGFEAEYLAPAKDLFKKEDAELAIRHAEECYQAALHLRNFGEDQLDALLSS